MGADKWFGGSVAKFAPSDVGHAQPVSLGVDVPYSADNVRQGPGSGAGCVDLFADGEVPVVMNRGKDFVKTATCGTSATSTPTALSPARHRSNNGTPSRRRFPG
ncbi:hypothetical protein [Arthrobacter sp. ISL-65]|uniref:hypothetical protein n=1 Tax=Arthrobacter sp. ISL-65 TaxID=2819112 RepID=UPI001BE6B103|nr:hypothetical protein [Arthrobacter sp. ISL-65]MBT2546851.1 hypothetical protein [Arthrobacter sp. ISL-65]